MPQKAIPQVHSPTVMVIEDEPELRELVVHMLRRAGFSVFSAGTAAEGLQIASERRPDVVLLDIRLPDLSGREICRRLRADPSTAGAHVMLASGLGDERDRLAGFEAGADDYLTKPYSLRELVMRVRAVVRRLEHQRAPISQPKRRREPAIPPAVRLDPSAHRAWVGEDEIGLTQTEFKLLEYLLSQTGRLCSRSELLQRVWDMPGHLNTRTVDTHVKRVRSKLGEAGPCIQTVRGGGYRFHGQPSPC